MGVLVGWLGGGGRRLAGAVRVAGRRLAGHGSKSVRVCVDSRGLIFALREVSAVPGPQVAAEVRRPPPPPHVL
ncbi:hypothetical protein Pcinc_024591 [Petrolisthes cinctipes]|uniref:Uncharacterized protein n=1 Tax=Petrolisthes cinctipes TaxID=88211 RepID=A0AAE1FAM9_PETCI|nr:hypothetical protein Pcinc_024591 [Petrolisthes cinctipes]